MPPDCTSAAVKLRFVRSPDLSHSKLKNSAFHTNTDTRSNAPARRDEDRVIRPLVRSRRVKLRIARFHASAKVRSLLCLSSSGKIIRICRRRSWRTSPGQYHLSVLLFNCRRESPYLSGNTPRVTVVLFLPKIPLVRAIGPGGGPGRRDKAPFSFLSGKPAQWDLLFSFCPFSRFLLHSLPFMYIILGESFLPLRSEGRVRSEQGKQDVSITDPFAGACRPIRSGHGAPFSAPPPASFPGEPAGKALLPFSAGGGMLCLPGFSQPEPVRS